MPKLDNPDWYRRPELILSDLLSSAARGDLLTVDRNVKFLMRAVVIAVDSEGGKLQNQSGEGTVETAGKDGRTKNLKALIGPENPRGAVKARILTAGRSRFDSDDDAPVFWPIFPTDQVSMPIAVGEHVYVMFEDEHYQHGLWIARVSGQDSANAFMGTDSYTTPLQQSSAMDSFEKPALEYPTDDSFAGSTLQKSAMDSFGD